MTKQYKWYAAIWLLAVALISCVPPMVKPETPEQIIAYNTAAVAGIKRQLGNMLATDSIDVDSALVFYSKADKAKESLSRASTLFKVGQSAAGQSEIELALSIITELQMELNKR